MDKFIIGEDSNLDSKVKQEVLRTNIFGGQPTTYLYDVLITYLKQCDFNKSNTIERLISWIKKYSKTSINEESFITFLYEERYINETQREKLVQELVIVQDKSEIVKGEDHKDNLTFKDVEEKHQNDEIAVTTIKKQNLIESKNIINKNNKKKHYRVTVIGIIVILIPSLYLGVKLIKRKNINEMSLINNEEAKEVSTVLGSKLKGKTFNPNVPEYMKYKEIDKEKLRGYLKTRNSLLLEEPYFSSIICSAKEFNLNPIVLFSITGQEQGFVPKDQTEAKKIANNPFNVFHSWQEYNTDIKDSSEIAARTVFNICREMPKDENVFKWINNTYAEDKNWHKGVESFFKLLN